MMYVCEECGETFDDGDEVSEEDRLAELHRNFPQHQHNDEMVVVCDGCYNHFMAKLN